MLGFIDISLNEVCVMFIGTIKYLTAQCNFCLGLTILEHTLDNIRPSGFKAVIIILDYSF